MVCNHGRLHQPKINHKKVLFLGHIFEDNLIRFTSPIILDSPFIVFVWSQFDGGKIDNRTILTSK